MDVHCVAVVVAGHPMMYRPRPIRPRGEGEERPSRRSPASNCNRCRYRGSAKLTSKPARLTRPQVITCVAVAIVLVGAVGFRLDIGVLALVAAVVLRLVTPTSSEQAEKSIAWGVVLLICGIVTDVSLLQHIGTIKRLG